MRQAEEMIRLREEVVWREFDGEVVVLDSRSWNYLGINSTGAELWPLVVRGATRDELVERLTGSYGIDIAVAERDVDAFVAGLRARQLLGAPAES
jgi:hypothetical protein